MKPNPHQTPCMRVGHTIEVKMLFPEKFGQHHFTPWLIYLLPPALGHLLGCVNIQLLKDIIIFEGILS